MKIKRNRILSKIVINYNALFPRVKFETTFIFPDKYNVNIIKYK